MRSAVLLATVVVHGLACGGGESPLPDSAPSDPLCAEAAQHSDLTWIQDNVLTPSCVFSTCHSGGGTTGATRLDFRPGQTRAHLVDFPSMVAPGRTLVVASQPAQSYLLVMLGQVAPGAADPPADPIPDDIGTMPQGSAGELLCPPVREAIERWIAAGAVDD